MNFRKDNVPDDFDEIHLIPYMHTDYSWTNSRRWHIWRYILAFKKVLELMREDDEFVYVIDNVHHAWLPFKQYCPELVEEFRTRVAEGRIIVANGGYSLARPNYSGEEAYVRNVVEGQRYFAAEFSIPENESHFFFNADTAIGHSQLPQILSLCGQKYYRSNRPALTMTNKGIPRQFRWKSPDGSEVIVARGDYGGLFRTDFFEKYPDMEKDWDKIRDSYWEIEKVSIDNSASEKLMMFFGCDDALPGCSLIDTPVPYKEFMAEWTKRERAVFKLSTPGRYFERLEAERESLPVLDGVLDHCELSYNSAYSGQASMWRRRRMLERKLLRLENTLSILRAYGENYDEKALSRLWQGLIDILGHALEYVLVPDLDPLLEQADSCALQCKLLQREAEELLAAKVNCRNDVENGITRYVVMNPIAEARRENVRVHVTAPYGLSGLRITDAAGEVLPYQVVQIYIADKDYPCECNSADIVVPVSLPASGWNTLTVDSTQGGVKHDRNELDDFIQPLDCREDPITVDTGAAQVTFCRGKVERVVYNGKTITGHFGALKFFENRPKSPGWFPFWQDEEFAFEPTEWGMLRNGELEWIYRVNGTLRTARATMDIILNRNSPRIDYRVTVNCEKNEGYYTASFPCDSDTELYADIPYGIEHRDLSTEPSAEVQATLNEYFFWETAWRGQFYARNFALFTAGGVNTMLMSDDCSIYYSLRRDLKTVSLLLFRQMDITDKSEERAARWVKLTYKELMGLGKHSFAFSYNPIPDGTKEELFHIAARETKLLHYPPSVTSKLGFEPQGDLPALASTLSHDGCPVILTATYYENGEKVIRGYDSSGIGGSVTLHSGVTVSHAYKADLLGHALDDAIEVNGSSVSFTVRSWEIFTVRIQEG